MVGSGVGGAEVMMKTMQLPRQSASQSETETPDCPAGFVWACSATETVLSQAESQVLIPGQWHSGAAANSDASSHVACFCSMA